MLENVPGFHMTSLLLLDELGTLPFLDQDVGSHNSLGIILKSTQDSRLFYWESLSLIFT